MTKTEFMTELQRALNGRLGSAEAAPHVNFYQEYIEIEVRNGREEKEVIDELGSPRLIAKNIGDSIDRNSQTYFNSERALVYGRQILKYGEKAGKKCVRIGTQAIGKAKSWFKNL